MDNIHYFLVYNTYLHFVYMVSKTKEFTVKCSSFQILKIIRF